MLAGELTIRSEFNTFCDDDFPTPVMKIFRGSDGSLFGAGGASSAGVLALGLDGTLTRLSNQATTALVQAGTGDLYAVRPGGAFGVGQIVRLKLNVPPFTFTPVVSGAPGPNAGVRLRWSPAWGATSYTIRRAVGAAPATVLASGVGTTAYVDTAVSARRHVPVPYFRGECVR